MSIWFTSDTHFSHDNILKFKDEEGKLVRAGFTSAEQMDELMIERWNDVVKPGDKVWHLGDVAFCNATKLAGIIRRLNGHKRLCLGNHDDLARQNLLSHFQKVHLWRVFKEHGFTCTHIPIPPDQFRMKTKMNVHGHIHHQPDPSPLHMNICVEKTDYRPIHLDEIIAEIKRRNL